jgi:hypothetical protein
LPATSNYYIVEVCVLEAAVDRFRGTKVCVFGDVKQEWRVGLLASACFATRASATRDYA